MIRILLGLFWFFSIYVVYCQTAESGNPANVGDERFTKPELRCAKRMTAYNHPFDFADYTG